MPRVSEAYRQARRDEIAAAALRVLARRGLRALTVADIIEESGLSAGSVYSHFRTKHEIIELVATHVIGERTDRLAALSAEQPPSPLEIVHWWLAGLEEDALPYSAVLQIWAEATSDPDIRTIVENRMAAIEEAFAGAAAQWLAAAGKDPTAAPAIGAAMLTICQGHIARSAILGPQDLEATINAIGLGVG